MGIELVCDEYPTRLRVGVQGGFDVSGKVLFGARWTDARTDELARSDNEVGDQTQRAVSSIFELDALGQTRSNRFGFMQPFTGLHPGFLVHTHHVRALLGKLWGLSVQLTQRFDVGLVLLRVFAFVLRGEPVLTLVRSQVRRAKKRSTWREEMLSTKPLFTASRASSAGVQCDTGKPLSEGGSHAKAINPAICSALNVAGAPRRTSSLNN